MQLTTLITATLATLTAATYIKDTTPFPVAPADLSPLHTSGLPHTPTLSKRLPANFRAVTYCANARGRNCVADHFRSSVCYRVSAGRNDRISSLYPGKETYCFLYDRTDYDGRGRNVMVTDPGVDDFKRIGLNDRVSNLKCVQYA